MDDLTRRVKQALKYRGNSCLILFTDTETVSDIALVEFRDGEATDAELWEWVLTYNRKLGVTAYPLNGTRYLVEYGIRDDSERTEYITVTPESELKWVQ